MWNTRGQFKPFDWQLPVEYFKILFKHISCISFRANITICKHLCHINIHRVILIVSFWWFLTHQGSINIMSVVCTYNNLSSYNLYLILRICMIPSCIIASKWLNPTKKIYKKLNYWVENGNFTQLLSKKWSIYSIIELKMYFQCNYWVDFVIQLNFWVVNSIIELKLYFQRNYWVDFVIQINFWVVNSIFELKLYFQRNYWVNFVNQLNFWVVNSIIELKLCFQHNYWVYFVN